VILSGGGEAASDGGAGASGAGATADDGGGGAGAATTGEAAAAGCSGSGGGEVCVVLETHWPFLKSCQGKQPLSDARFRFGPACAGGETEKLRQIKIAALAKMRVMPKPRRQPKWGAEPVSGATFRAETAKSRVWHTFRRQKRLFATALPRFA